ncbi:YHS domain-containing protein [Haladaptatus sp. QDMS2]|uniref:YHS domain-containing protein n=2 Tax=unclassified Haladaptatus TaxID=2622732 RepID=UPI0034E988D8
MRGTRSSNGRSQPRTDYTFESTVKSGYCPTLLRTTNKTDGCDSLDMQAALADGILESYNSETYHFCSNRCKRSFEENPAEFAQKHPQISGTGPSQSHEQH